MESGPPSSRKIANLEFDKAKKSRTFSTKHYLPAGSYVSARMITGVDASVGVSAQSDPRPVEFRVTSKAKSAAFKSKTQEIDIVGCTITGAASGDLSSEKAFIRLLKMTCAKDEETVIETDVVGYAAGLGSAGIRGKVISREGDLVTKSFLAGVVGGIGNSAAQSLQPTPSIFGNNQNPELKDIAGSGLGKGVGNASNRVESYLISRAEQYQPVISVPTTDVELVFEEGVYLDGRGEPQ